MPPQFNERVGKWTHEPRSNLNHKKHLSKTFAYIFIFSTKLFRKYKDIFISLHTQPKPKNIITIAYLLYCIVIYSTVLHIIFTFTYIHTLCLTTTRWSWGHKNEKLFCRRTGGAFSTVPREFDINPEFPSWGKFTLATTLCTWSPNLAHLLSVISQQMSSALQHIPGTPAIGLQYPNRIK
jgi:hypothetical protein